MSGHRESVTNTVGQIHHGLGRYTCCSHLHVVFEDDITVDARSSIIDRSGPRQRYFPVTQCRGQWCRDPWSGDRLRAKLNEAKKIGKLLELEVHDPNKGIINVATFTVKGDKAIVVKR